MYLRILNDFRLTFFKYFDYYLRLFSTKINTISVTTITAHEQALVIEGKELIWNIEFNIIIKKRDEVLLDSPRVLTDF